MSSFTGVMHFYKWSTFWPTLYIAQMPVDNAFVLSNLPEY